MVFRVDVDIIRNVHSSSDRPGQEVRFPDGTPVFALHIDARNGGYSPPDFGLYLDMAWRPDWPSTVIPWEDFEDPPDRNVLFEEVLAAFRRAKSGQWVEIGCLAACGRTGTVLACMATLAEVPADEAILWVRTHYDNCAVETLSQKALINEFEKWFSSLPNLPTQIVRRLEGNTSSLSK